MPSSLDVNKENLTPLGSDDDDSWDTNDGAQRFPVYRGRFDNGEGDRFYVNVYREDTGEFTVDINQVSGMNSVSNTINQVLSFTAEQWKVLQHVFQHFMSMWGLLRHDPTFNSIGFHVVGLVHADVYMVNALPTIILYQGQRGGVIRRLAHSSIRMSFELLRNLQTQFTLVDMNVPEIEEETPCFQKEDHANVEGCMQCRNCNPFGNLLQK